MNDITKLIHDISLNNKIVGEYDVDDIYEILVRENSLNDFVKNIKLGNFNMNSLAFYSPYKKIIYINYKVMLYSIMNYIERNKMLVDSNNNYYLMNLYILKILIHELKHVEQEKIMVYNKNSVEAKILMKSNKLEEYYKQNKLYSDLLYRCNPIERQAELHALMSIIDVSSKLFNNKLTNFFYLEYMNNKLENYSFCKTIKYPASIFFDNYLGYDDINYFNNSYKSDIDKRLELGLKINKDEYNDIKNKN